MQNTLHDLFKHMAWADAATWRTVLVADAAAGDERLRQLLHHIHTVQHAFLRVWTNQPPERRGLAAFPDLPALARWGKAYHERMAASWDAVMAPDLNSEVIVPWVKRVEQRLARPVAATTRLDTMLQAAMHSTHHRAQVSMRLRELGIEPPTTDFIGWVWLRKPIANWPDI